MQGSLKSPDACQCARRSSGFHSLAAPAAALHTMSRETSGTYTSTSCRVAGSSLLVRSKRRQATVQRASAVTTRAALKQADPQQHANNSSTSHSQEAGASRGIVITGGSSGLGFALAREFLSCGDRLVLCGRDSAKLQAALQALQREFPGAAVDGIRCDVANGHDVAALGEFAADKLGVVHLWLNNAGQVTSKRLLADLEAAEVAEVVGTNMLGTLLGCREAIRLMRRQPQQRRPAYHIFNLGFSSWGAKFTKSAVTHKSTKTALAQLTESLSEELAEAGLTSIGVHNLSPGMVLTDLLLKDSTPGARRFFNTLAEEPETVAAALAPRIRSVQGTRQSIEFLSPVSAFGRVIAGLPQIIRGGRFFDGQGERVRRPGRRYKDNGVQLPFS